MAIPGVEAETRPVLAEVVEELAGFERRAGSEGEHRAAEWIARRLRACDCEADVEEADFHAGYAGLMRGLSLAEMDLIELNEAFAAQALAVLREWDLPDGLERVNVNGSGISLGHPIGATGGRILATLLRELHRRGARYGLETMCIGGGQGLAAIFENLHAA